MRVGLVSGALVPRAVVTVEAKDASSLIAAASSFKVFKVAGAVSRIFETAVSTYAVVAIWVVLFPWVAVGDVGIPVNAGASSGALVFNCVWIAEVTPFKYPISVSDTSVTTFCFVLRSSVDH
jgi:glycopeptide antibiotics resistance protein